MSRPIPSITGIVRSARKIPPMPSVSAIVWRSPWRAGISKSSSVAACPPTWIMLNAKSAPASASRRSRWVENVGEAPSCCAVQRAIASPVARRSGSMSWSAISSGPRSSKESRSPSRSRVNSMLPAPMNAMRVTGGSISYLRDSAHFRRDSRRNAQVPVPANVNGGIEGEGSGGGGGQVGRFDTAIGGQSVPLR